MKLNTNEIKFLKFLTIILFLLTSIAIATETTWRHPGFEVAQYDINFTSIYNITELRVLEWGWNTSVPSVSGTNRAITYYNATDNKLLISKNGGSYYEAAVEGAVTNTSAQVTRSQVTGQEGVDTGQNTSITNLGLVDDVINSTKLNKTELNSTIDRNLSNYTNTPSFVTNETVNPYSFNASNATSVLPNASIPASAMNLSSSRGLTYVRLATDDQLNLVSGVSTKINLNTKVFDSDNSYNLTTMNYTVPEDGYYRITPSIQFGTPVALKRYDTGVYINGIVNYTVYGHASLVSSLTVSGDIIISLLSGDTIELYGASNSGDNTVDVFASAGTMLTVEFVRRLS